MGEVIAATDRRSDLLLVYLRSAEQPRVYVNGGQMHYSKMARKLRQKIAAFSGELSSGMPKVANRFVGEMLYGIQASQSVVLTKIARTLEEPISVKKVHERLCRQLVRKGLGEHIQRSLLRLSAGLVGKDTLLILDTSDIQKQYARKMQYLGKVRDGSEDEIGSGYWTCNVVATEVQGSRIVPLLGRLYSAEAPGVISENRKLLSVMDRVAAATGKRGIWVIDRGGDRRKLMFPMLQKGYRFLIRLVGSRYVQCGSREVIAEELAKDCPLPYGKTIVKVEDGKEKAYQLAFGYRNVRLPGNEATLGLLVVRGFRKEPMMLLTTEPLRRSRKVLWRLVQAYLRRWSI